MMETVATQKSRDDRTSACRSFGRNYHPCSQTRKISIGVMVDSLEKWRPQTANENEAALPSMEKTFRKLSSVGDISEGEQAIANSKGNQNDQERNTSPWVSTKSTHSKKPMSEAISYSKPALDIPTGGSDFHRSIVETSANQSGLQSNSDNLKKFNRVYSRKVGEEKGERERTTGLPPATSQEVFVPEREVVEDKAIGPEDRRQVLRMKLWEILGANSSQNKQPSQTPELSGNNLNPEPDINHKCEAVKPKQNSDTIESDSLSPDHTIKRAVTRSLTRKKAVSKVPTAKTRNAQTSTSMKKSMERNIFSFNEGQFGKVNGAVTGGFPKSYRKSLGRKGSKIEARRINFLEDQNAGGVQPEIDMSKTTKGPEKTSSIGNSMRSYQKSPPKDHSVFCPENGNKENSFSLFSANNKGGRGSKGEAARFSFPEKLISNEVQPAIDSSKTIKGARKTSSIGSKMKSYQNFSPQSSSRLVDAEIGNQENGSSLSSALKSGRKGTKAEEGRICFPKKVNPEGIQLEADLKKTTKDVEKASSIGKRTRNYRTSLPEDSSKFVDAEIGDREKDVSISTVKKSGNTSLLRIPHCWDQQEDFGTSPFKSATNPHRDFQNPTFEDRTPAETFSPGPPPKANHGELDDQSPENYSFNSLVALKPDDYSPDAGIRTSIDAEEVDSPLTKSGPTMAEQDAEDAAYTSSPEKMDSESSKAGWESPDIGTRGNPEFFLYPNKRLRSQENFEFQHFSPTEGTGESDGSQEPLEKNGESGVANAISLLAMAVQRVKSKIKTATSKKSTEVLMSVAEEVHLQLQNAESQFERDVGKLTSLSKSKRKHLEAEIEEQQEQLKVIYQKFKADVSQHIQDHRSKVEGLQGQEKELRLFMEKRKSSQKEVLKQMEESIQSQLSDAETRIAAVHKMGREKMLQLKQALGKCFKEGMLG